MAKKKMLKKSPLAGRHVVVVAPTVLIGNHAVNLIQAKQKLKERPVVSVGPPRGLSAFAKVAVVPVTGQALPADWCEQMERQLDDIKFFNEAELV